MRRSVWALAVTSVTLVATASPVQADLPAPHVGFSAIHPRVGLSTSFALSASWVPASRPEQMVAKVHPSGQRCGTDPAHDSGRIIGSSVLTAANGSVAWKDWTPAASGSYVVCTWLGRPVIAANAAPLTIDPRSAGVPPAGTLVDAATSVTPNGRPRAHFATAPRQVYARFALRGVQRGQRVTIEFRDTDGHVVLTRATSGGPELAWYTARVSRERLTERLGYWIASIRVGSHTLGSVHFVIPYRPPSVRVSRIGS